MTRTPIRCAFPLHLRACGSDSNIAAPVLFPEPVGGPPDTDANFESSSNDQQGFNVGDTIRFNERWSTRLGVSQDWFHTDNYNVAGTQISKYSESGLKPGRQHHLQAGGEDVDVRDV